MGTMIIKNGTVVDGTGGAPQKLDVAVTDGRISEIGAGLPAGDATIDAEGLVVSPGFIDLHTHTDATIFSYPLAESKLLQGVTTDTTGHCGIGCFPVSFDAAKKEELLQFLRLLTKPEFGTDQIRALCLSTEFRLVEDFEFARSAQVQKYSVKYAR